MHDGGGDFGGGDFGGGDFGGHVSHTGHDPGIQPGAHHHGHGQHGNDGVPWYTTIGQDRLGGTGRPGRTRAMAGAIFVLVIIVIIALAAAI
jgi:hypothetical protein